MYVCVCHGITERDVRRAAEEGVRDVHALTMRVGLGSSCGSCLPLAAELLAEASAVKPFPLQVLRAA